MCDKIRSYYDRVRSCMCVSVGGEGLEKVWECGTRETEDKADRGVGCNNGGGGGNFGDLKVTRFSWSPLIPLLPLIVGVYMTAPSAVYLRYLRYLRVCMCVCVCVCVHACIFV